MIPLDLTIDETGVLLAEAVQLMGTLEAACIHEQPEGQPLPRGLLTCGEACRMIPAIIALATELHPELLEDAALEQAIRSYAMRRIGGEPN